LARASSLSNRNPFGQVLSFFYGWRANVTIEATAVGAAPEPPG